MPMAAKAKFGQMGSGSVFADLREHERKSGAESGICWAPC